LTSAADLDAPTRRALRRQLLTLADSKRLLGLRYSDWLLGAPAIEAGIAASGMAQDEWGHARLLYAMLKDLDEDPVALEHDRPAEAYASLDALDRPFDDWAQVVAAIVVVDGALTVALEAFARGAYALAGARIPKMVAEEAFHADLGRAWVRRLAAGTPDSRQRLAEALAAFLPRTLAWLGADDEAARALTGAGVVSAAGTRLADFRDRLGTLLSGAGVALDDVAPDTEAWDEARGRGPGAPDLEAVERARGDLNRALFVE
jgi:ring-1,2-phenylacetyl-CoA epoxidase subunit PaaC